MTTGLTTPQRIGIALSALWLLGVIVFASIEFAMLPEPLTGNSGPPRGGHFFDWLPETAQHHDVPGIGIVAFPASMTQSAVVEALHRNYPESFAKAQREVKWNVQVDKPDVYYNIRPRYSRMAILLLVPVLGGWLLIGALIATVKRLSTARNQH